MRKVKTHVKRQVIYCSCLTLAKLDAAFMLVCVCERDRYDVVQIVNVVFSTDGFC